MRRLGLLMLAVVALVSVFAPWLTLHPVAHSYGDHVLAPPMPVQFRDGDGHWTVPYVYPLRVVDRLAREYATDTSARVAVFSDGAEWFPLGTDSLGRDVWSRLVAGSRVSLGLSLLSCVLAIAFGTIVGACAGYAGGRLETIAMRLCEFLVVLPATYVVLTLRAALPLALTPGALFTSMAAVLAIAGTPHVARAARAVVASERGREYVEAARAAGASNLRILARHLVPACAGILAGQALLLLPAFVLAESTLSFIGLGFDPSVPSWGTMLQEAANIRAISEYPWVLAPAAALTWTVLGFNLLAEERDERVATRSAPGARPLAAAEPPVA